MNQEAHWNNIADRYDDEVFDVFQSDKHQILQRYFDKHVEASHTATDFGCGIGKAFRYLAPRFQHVLALDISDDCIDIAKANPYTNITYQQQDLTVKNLKLPQANFALCCNVAILPDIDDDRAILKNIARGLKPGGHAIIVVPSIESAMFSSWRLVDWYKREGVSKGRIPKSELQSFDVRIADLVQGVIEINGVPTKHYSREELQVLLEEAGFTLTALEKLEYDWRTEFSTPPRWMGAPYPWDWMIECKKA